MLQNSKKKICIIVDCLSGGGAEKQAANLSKSLHKEGFEVSIISLKDQITYGYKGTLYNLGKKESSIKSSNKYKSFLRLKKHIKIAMQICILTFERAVGFSWNICSINLFLSRKK